MREVFRKAVRRASFLCALLLGGPLLVSVLISPIASAQESPASQPPTPAAPTPSPEKSADKNSAELSSHDEAATFKVNVKLVLVRVVVRDSKGHAIGNLRKEDFQLFDNRKPQTITHFSLEQPGSQIAKEKQTSESAPGEPQNGEAPAIAERFVAYLFDDVHLEFADLAMVRNAADHHLGSLKPTDRAAIFTTSGQTMLDFTDDKAKLHEALKKIRPQSIARTSVTECPNVSYYMADLIQNKRDDRALRTATMDALACEFQNNPRMLNAAEAEAQAAAARQLSLGDQETRLALGTLKDVVRRVSAMPGQRSIILVSPGFLVPDQLQEESELMERAMHSNVIIGALDARGLFAPVPGGDASQPGNVGSVAEGQRNLYELESISAQADVLAELAYGTGGVFYHNNNDLEEGFRQVASAPEYFYVLGFAPQNLKLDGRFHSLKVAVKDPPKLSIQARRGYYAPRHVPDPAEEAKQEIEDALFSQEELHDLPVELHTQFFKSTDADAKLAVLVHVDVKRMRFHKLDGRNRNELTVVSGLFDRNGNYLKGVEKVLQMRLLDETLDHKLGSGITLKSSFDVKPGSYLVRLVVRDAEGQVSAQNGAIEIP